jgi:ribosomal protein S18 acetylase RimI-like enzyme
VARPLIAHEFDTQVASKLNFDAAGLIVAERDRRIVGYAHAGFGPNDQGGRPNRLDHGLGTIAMLVVDPACRDGELEQALIDEAERYLRSRGATVIYAGGQLPLNPFYWGIYGGSEFSGILSNHVDFTKAVVRAGYVPVSEAVLLEADLAEPELRDPRAPLIRRVTRLEVTEDAMPEDWWQSLAIGGSRPNRFRLLNKNDDHELARATTWDMSGFGRVDGKSRLGLIAVEVDPTQRRKGYGRHLLNEIFRRARAEMVSTVAVQTRLNNTSALALYRALGFSAVESSTLYRLPAEAAGRA